MIKLKITIALSIALLIFGFSVTLYANPEDELKVSIKAGYNDTIRIYSECPFYIEIENGGKNFRGEIQIHRVQSYGKKINYSLPFEIPQGSKKEFMMNIPINNAIKDVDVKIMINDKEAFSKKYQFKDIILPETSVVGLLTNEPEGVRGLYNASLLERRVLEQSKNFPKRASQGTYEITDTKRTAKVIELNENNLPENKELLETFDFIIISDYDTSLLSDFQKAAISNWVDKGNLLVIAAGENVDKVYSGLDESLKPFKIHGQKRIEMPESFADFTERNILEEQMYVSTGAVGNGDVIIGDENNPLAINYIYGNGNIIILSFDPTTRPISKWNYSKDMWERLLEYNRQASVNYYTEFNYDTSDLGELDYSPLIFLYATVLIYILAVGPILYWILKRKDKRDYSWIIIPSLAFLFVGIIYFGGYKTRYKSAIMNNFSIIELDFENKKINVNSFGRVYNNKKGNLKIECPTSYNLAFHSNNYYDSMYNESDSNIAVTSKISFEEPKIYEIYNMYLWESINTTFSMSKQYDGKIVLQDVQIDENKVSGIIKNNTSFLLEDCYIVLDGIYISVGNINPKGEKHLKINLLGDDTKNNFDLFMDVVFPKTAYSSTYAIYDTAEGREQLRKRKAHEFAHGNIVEPINIQNISNENQTVFVALNYEDFGHKFKVNKRTPETINTNVIYTVKTSTYEKGKNITFKKGHIKPILDNPEDFSIEKYMEYVFFTDIEAKLTFNIHKNFEIEKFEIDWSKVKVRDFYILANAENKMDNYILYIKNNTTNEWEEIGKVFKVDTNVKDYVDRSNKIRLKADITFTEQNFGHDYLVIPELEVSGVMK